MTSPLVTANSFAVLRGDIVPFADANLSIASSPVLYGLAIYTVFSVNYNADKNQLLLFRLDDHYRRLNHSARIMGFSSIAKKYPSAKFEALMIELLQRNQIREDVLVRVSLFIDAQAAGTKIDGLPVELMAYVSPMGEILPKSGAHVCVSSWTRTSDNMIPSRAKLNGSYINASLMKNEALLNGYDDAISLDAHGKVAEGTVANVFVVRNGTLITPSAQNDILEGITRDTVRRLALDLGIPYLERSVDRTELYLADEVMFVGSSASVTPILSIDKRAVGDGRIGPVTKQLTRGYRQIQTGAKMIDESWLTRVHL